MFNTSGLTLDVIKLTKAWQLAQNAEEFFRYSEILGDALFAIRLIRLQRKGIKTKGVFHGLENKVKKASKLLDELIRDLTNVSSGGYIRHINLVKLLEEELSVNDPEALKKQVSRASQELKEFLQGKRNIVENAEEILGILSYASRRVAHESFRDLTLLYRQF